MSFRRAAALVARREIVERVRERSLLISTVVTIAIIAAIVVLPTALGFGDDERYKVAVAGPQAERVAQAARAVAPGFDARIEVVRVADDGAVRRSVNAEDSDAGITSSGDSIVVREELEDALGLALQEGSRRRRVREQPPPPLPVRTLDAAAKDSGELQSLAFVAVILLYGQLIGYGFWLASGIVEEKASRIVEVLLATIPPRALLLGKIVGIGLVGFGQLLLIGLIGVGLGVATGTVDLAGDAIGAVAVVLAWFLLGYAFYACMFAMAGALVPRQEDIQNSTGPLTVVLVGSFLLSFSAIEEPGGTLARVLSVVPPTAPMVSPVRIIAGDMPLAEIALSIAVLLVSTGLLVAAAARVYENAVLRTSTRVRLRDAWRSAQS